MECRDSEIFTIIPMHLFLKSFNYNDKEICVSFLPEIDVKGHKLNTVYNSIKDELVKMSKQVSMTRKKTSDKENKGRNRKRIFGSNYKSLLNRTKFLKSNSFIEGNDKFMDRELYLLSNF